MRRQSVDMPTDAELRDNEDDWMVGVLDDWMIGKQNPSILLGSIPGSVTNLQ